MKNKKLPHQGVFVRLIASPIHGVGVFAIRPIKKGTNPFACNNNVPMVWVSKKVVDRLPKSIKKLYVDFGVLKNGRYGVAQNFNKLTPEWFINHLDNPNIGTDENYNFIALRNIRVGEELTSNYNLYSEE